MLEFFEFLFGDNQGWVPVFTFPESERESGKEWKHMDLKPSEWFEWPKQQKKLVKYCEAHRKEDVYMTITLCKIKSNRKQYMLPTNVIHCDSDTARPSLFAAQPSAVVESSPGRYQLYWRLKSPLDPELAENLAQRIAYSQRPNGADTGWQINKVLRVPETTNTKPDYDLPRVKVKYSGEVYSYKSLDKYYKGIAVRSKAKMKYKPRELPEVSEVLAKMPASGGIWELYSEPARVTSWNKDGSRYVQTYKLACSLFRLDFTPEEVFVACSTSANNKYEQDGRDPEEMWRDVLNAQQEVDGMRNVVFVGEDEDGTPISTIVDIDPGVSLLSNQERLMIQPTVIDNYITWASKRTLADPNYHIANGITVLSTLLSEHGYALPGHGSMNLELWFMVLGVTTRSYKTTAANQMLRVLENIQKNRPEAAPYLLAPDPTPQALTRTLSARGEVSGLLHVDEAHLLVESSKSGGYMSGMTGLLTLLYDGKVPAVDRIGREGTPSSRTHLTMNLLGVPGKMTDVLTKEDFASGFLARFLFVFGQPAPDDEQSMFLAQGDPNQPRDMDPELNDLLWQLNGMVNSWEGRGLTPIIVEDDAWVRWNKFVYDLRTMAVNSSEPEAMEPTARRMGVSVHKLACLLAMAEGCTRATMRHVVTAINYAESWYDAARIMVGLVSQNKWARLVNEVISHIGVGNKRLYTAVYKKFDGLRVREFDEVIEAAEKMGRLRVNKVPKENGSNYLYLEVI